MLNVPVYVGQANEVWKEREEGGGGRKVICQMCSLDSNRRPHNHTRLPAAYSEVSVCVYECVREYVSLRECV